MTRYNNDNCQLKVARQGRGTICGLTSREICSFTVLSQQNENRLAVFTVFSQSASTFNVAHSMASLGIKEVEGTYIQKLSQVPDQKNWRQKSKKGSTHCQKLPATVMRRAMFRSSSGCSVSDMSSVCPLCPPAGSLSAHHYFHTKPSELCCLVVDSGFSFTHIAPYCRSRKMKEGIRRSWTSTSE